MSTLNANLRGFFLGDNVDIPADWLEDTNFADKYLQSMDVSYDGTSPTGGATHTTHQLAAHTHTEGTHTHSVSSSTDNGSQTKIGGGTTNFAISRSHSHASSTSATATVTYSTQAAETTSSPSATAEPPYVTVLVLKPDGATTIPVNMVLLSDDSSSAPSGYSIETTIDGKFLKGTSSGGNGGGTGGASTHTHTMPSSHTHTSNAHTHASAACGSAVGSASYSGSGRSFEATSAHHNVSLASQTTPNLSSGTASLDSQSNEPAYVELVPVKKTTSAAAPVAGVIMAYDGDASAIPDGWRLMDGRGGTVNCRNLQLKMTQTPANVGTTGGSNTHSHTDSGHTHSYASSSLHFHTATVAWSGSIGSAGAGTNAGLANATHTHATWTVTSNSLPGVDNATPSTDSVDIRHPYRKVVLVKKTDSVRSVTLRGDISLFGDVTLR